MPRAVVALPNDIETITRPVVLDVCRELIRALRMDNGSVQVVYPGGATETLAQPGSAADDDGNRHKFGSNPQLSIEVQERAVEDRVLTMAVQQNEHSPVFLDKALDVAIVPVYAMHEVQISFTYRARNRSEAQRFKHDMLMRVANLRDVQPVQVNYSYSIPYEFLHMLLAVFQRREALAGYGDDFDKYLHDHLDGRATQVVNAAGKWPQLRIPEQQIHNWGTFGDFVPAMDPANKEKDNGTWMINFNYRFQYDKPIGCRAVWPMVVHNQMMPFPWVNDQNASGQQIDPWRQKYHSSLTRHAMDVIANNHVRPCVAKYNEAICPPNDEWYPKHERPDMSSIVQNLIMIDPNDLHDVIDLKNLGDHAKLDDDVLTFLKSEARYLNSYGESICHVAMYENDVPLADSSVTVSPFLAVRQKNPMDLRKNYHTRLTVSTNLHGLRPSARRRLQEGGKGAWKLLIDLQYRIFDSAYYPELINDTYISPADIEIIARRLLRYKRPVGDSREAVMLTVGTYTVVTKPMHQLEIDRASLSDSTARPGGDDRYHDRCEGQAPCNGC
ncbi:hypothetical protein [Stenotrophomonas sp. GD03657]|uniref:hypothetical protein n=1 Tax=Stenotrophomonas sp. GD03657 TaxID=2975363 RepID=UPI00244BFB59|nr:hypothetical protein [Stenotrophomonas sp. GD03657]MDH2154037.1 hypothetical protein [Stenotrophomonas sp. GD03657]